MRIALLACTSLAALACKSSPPPAAPPGGGGGDTVDERQACAADTDCAVVELGCCDHCNGGKVAGVHKDFAADVHTSYAGDCSGTACTLMACMEQPSAVCQAGTCAVKIGERVDATPLPAK